MFCSCDLLHHSNQVLIQSIKDTSSCRLSPSNLNGFKTIATVNPFLDLTVSKISAATVWYKPYPALAT